jgi:hypothetical protein
VKSLSKHSAADLGALQGGRVMRKKSPSKNATRAAREAATLDEHRTIARVARELGDKLSSKPLIGSYVAATGYAIGKPPLKPPGKPPERGAHAFEARKDGSLVIYVTSPDGATHWSIGEPIRIEPHRVLAVLAACGDALARKPSVR